MGMISITGNAPWVLEMLNSGADIKVINMDEDGNPEYKIPLNHPAVIGGTCLLPPMEALIAAADGEREVFEMIYAEYFSTPFIESYIAALIIYLCQGHNLIIYYEDGLDITDEIIQMFWMKYGIGISRQDQSTIAQHDFSCAPIWLKYMYVENVITGEEFLYHYPEGTPIDPMLMERLIMELKPCGKTIEEKSADIYSLMRALKYNPNVMNAFEG